MNKCLEDKVQSTANRARSLHHEKAVTASVKGEVSLRQHITKISRDFKPAGQTEKRRHGLTEVDVEARSHIYVLRGKHMAGNNRAAIDPAVIGCNLRSNSGNSCLDIDCRHVGILAREKTGIAYLSGKTGRIRRETAHAAIGQSCVNPLAPFLIDRSKITSPPITANIVGRGLRKIVG